MNYQGHNQFQHNRAIATGILLVNLGTPDAPTPTAIRRYLAEFLSDPRVVETPRLLWRLILHGIILRIRPRVIAKTYASIWTEKGSPLLVESQALCDALQTACNETLPGPVHVKLAMSYGHPSIADGLAELKQKNVERLLVLPMYPQYSATTTAAIFDAVTQQLQRWRWLPQFRMLMHYHDHPAYIQAIANRIRQTTQQHGQPDKLLFSYHGIPVRYFKAGDPYFCHCQKTTRLVVEQLALKDDQWQLCFQSRFGREPWLQPYTDKTLASWAEQGIKSVQVISPGFAADCLETLEELAIQNKEQFLEKGGETFHYIPALNADSDHVSLYLDLIQQETKGWAQTDPQQTQENTEDTLQHAKALGASQ